MYPPKLRNVGHISIPEYRNENILVKKHTHPYYKKNPSYCEQAYSKRKQFLP